jgi:hypothetical protein
MHEPPTLAGRITRSVFTHSNINDILLLIEAALFYAIAKAWSGQSVQKMSSAVLLYLEDDADSLVMVTG